MFWSCKCTIFVTRTGTLWQTNALGLLKTVRDPADSFYRGSSDLTRRFRQYKKTVWYTEVYLYSTWSTSGMSDPIRQLHLRFLFSHRLHNGIVAFRFTEQMDSKGVMHNVHLYLDTVNAPPSAIAITIDKVCKSVGAELIVMASSNKVCGVSFDQWSFFQICISCFFWKHSSCKYNLW